MGTEETNIIFTSVLLAVITFAWWGYLPYLLWQRYGKYKADIKTMNALTAHKKTALSTIDPNAPITKHVDKREIASVLLTHDD